MPIEKDFWNKLAKKHGISEEVAKAFAENEGFMGEINEMALRRDDAKQTIEAANAEKAAAEQAKRDAMSKYQENLTWFGQKQADLMLLDDYRKRFGELTADNGNGNGTRQQEIASPVDMNKLNDQIRNSQREVYSLTAQILDASDDYRDRFGKALPRKELEALAMKPENAGRDFKDVYADWVKPKVQEKETTELEARIKTERDKAYAEGLAKGRMHEPTQGSPDDISPLYGPRIKKEDLLDDTTLQRHFVETFDKNMEAERSASTA